MTWVRLAAACSLVLALGPAACAAGPAPSPASAAIPTFDPAIHARLEFKKEGFADLGPAGPYYPDRAQRMRTHGYALLACGVKDDGTLTGCEVKEENPTGWGFGLASLKMAEHGHMKAAQPISTQPRTTDGRVLALVTFTAP